MSDPAEVGSTVYVVDDDPAMREALAFSLRTAHLQPRIFSTPEAMLRTGPIDAPAVILLDVRLQQASGVDFHAQLLAQGVRSPVIFMSGQSRPQEIVDGFRQGALHFLIKPFSTADLLAAIHEALKQDRERVEREVRQARLRERLGVLTPREREVFRFMLKGYPNRDIAAALGTAAGTVKLQRASVFAKLHAGSMSELTQMFAGEDLDRLLAGPRHANDI